MKQNTNISTKRWQLLSTIWKVRPDIKLSARFKFRYFLYRFDFPKSIQDITFEKFIIAHKYKTDRNLAAFLSVISGKSQALIEQLPIRLTLPIYESYSQDYEVINKRFEDYAELYNEKQSAYYDMKEFGYSSIALLLSGNNRQQAKEFILKQSMAYILAEFRREMKIAENQRVALEKISKKNEK